MDTYEVELEPVGPDGFAAVIPAFPGLLVLGRDVDEVLERVRAAIAFHDGRGRLPVRLVVTRQSQGEQIREVLGLGCGQRNAHTREPVGDRPRVT
jgi:hypothetical protein